MLLKETRELCIEQLIMWGREREGYEVKLVHISVYFNN